MAEFIQPLQGKNMVGFAQPTQGGVARGAGLTLGYYMQPFGAKIQTSGTRFRDEP